MFGNLKRTCGYLVGSLWSVLKLGSCTSPTVDRLMTRTCFQQQRTVASTSLSLLSRKDYNSSQITTHLDQTSIFLPKPLKTSK